MITEIDLARRLRERSAPQIARAAGLSLKTVYRLRDGTNSPTLQTVHRLLAALDMLDARDAKR
jgi:DNA-binding phage protein